MGRLAQALQSSPLKESGRDRKGSRTATANLLAGCPTPLPEVDVTLDNRQQHAWTRVVALALVVIWSSWTPHARAQQIGRSPVEVLLPQPPTAAAALGRLHLVYELHLTNFGTAAVSLDGLDVLDEGRHSRVGLALSWRHGSPCWVSHRAHRRPRECCRQAHAPSRICGSACNRDRSPRAHSRIV